LCVREKPVCHLSRLHSLSFIKISCYVCMNLSVEVRTTQVGSPCTRRGRVRQIISNARSFQRGDWKGLWETALRFARRETYTNAKRQHIRTKRDT
jgi:hypothetical protein